MQTPPNPAQFTASVHEAVAETRARASQNLRFADRMYEKFRTENETRPGVTFAQNVFGIRPGWAKFTSLYTHLLSWNQTWENDEACNIAHLEYDTINMLNTNRAGGAVPENLTQKRADVDSQGAAGEMRELFRASPDYTVAIHHLPIRSVDTARLVYNLSRFPGHERLPLAVIITALWAGMNVERTFELANLPAPMVDAILAGAMRRAGH